MRILLALALLLAAAVIYLGWRVVALDRQLSAVNAQLGTRAPSSGAVQAQPHARAPKPSAAQGIEPRLAALERQVASLRADLSSLEAATETSLNPPPADPKQILSVVSGEVSRIRDKQLEFQHEQWVKWRRGTLAAFTKAHNLNDQQRAQLDRLLMVELDSWTALFRRADLADRPEQFAREAREALRETDEAARTVLAPEQYIKWVQIRAAERMTLWPFLPE